MSGTEAAASAVLEAASSIPTPYKQRHHPVPKPQRPVEGGATREMKDSAETGSLHPTLVPLPALVLSLPSPSSRPLSESGGSKALLPPAFSASFRFQRNGPDVPYHECIPCFEGGVGVLYRTVTYLECSKATESSIGTPATPSPRQGKERSHIGGGRTTSVGSSSSLSSSLLRHHYGDRIPLSSSPRRASHKRHKKKYSAPPSQDERSDENFKGHQKKQKVPQQHSRDSSSLPRRGTPRRPFLTPAEMNTEARRRSREELLESPTVTHPITNHCVTPDTCSSSSASAIHTPERFSFPATCFTSSLSSVSSLDGMALGGDAALPRLHSPRKPDPPPGILAAPQQGFPPFSSAPSTSQTSVHPPPQHPPLQKQRLRDEGEAPRHAARGEGAESLRATTPSSPASPPVLGQRWAFYNDTADTLVRVVAKFAEGSQLTGLDSSVWLTTLPPVKRRRASRSTMPRTSLGGGKSEGAPYYTSLTSAALEQQVNHHPPSLYGNRRAELLRSPVAGGDAESTPSPHQSSSNSSRSNKEPQHPSPQPPLGTTPPQRTGPQHGSHRSRQSHSSHSSRSSSSVSWLPHYRPHRHTDTPAVVAASGSTSNPPNWVYQASLDIPPGATLPFVEGIITAFHLDIHTEAMPSEDVVFENGEPCVTYHKLFKCFKHVGNGLLFRMVNHVTQEWFFYNDTKEYEMKVVVDFAFPNEVEPLGRTTPLTTTLIAAKQSVRDEWMLTGEVENPSSEVFTVLDTALGTSSPYYHTNTNSMNNSSYYCYGGLMHSPNTNNSGSESRIFATATAVQHQQQQYQHRLRLQDHASGFLPHKGNDQEEVKEGPLNTSIKRRSPPPANSNTSSRREARDAPPPLDTALLPQRAVLSPAEEPQRVPPPLPPGGLRRETAPLLPPVESSAVVDRSLPGVESKTFLPTKSSPPPEPPPQTTPPITGGHPSVPPRSPLFGVVEEEDGNGPTQRLSSDNASGTAILLVPLSQYSGGATYELRIPPGQTCPFIRGNPSVYKLDVVADPLPLPPPIPPAEDAVASEAWEASRQRKSDSPPLSSASSTRSNGTAHSARDLFLEDGHAAVQVTEPSFSSPVVTAVAMQPAHEEEDEEGHEDWPLLPSPPSRNSRGTEQHTEGRWSPTTSSFPTLSPNSRKNSCTAEYAPPRDTLQSAPLSSSPCLDRHPFPFRNGYPNLDIIPHLSQVIPCDTIEERSDPAKLNLTEQIRRLAGAALEEEDAAPRFVLFRLVDETLDIWAFYNDHSAYAMKVVVRFPMRFAAVELAPGVKVEEILQRQRWRRAPVPAVQEHAKDHHRSHRSQTTSTPMPAGDIMLGVTSLSESSTRVTATSPAGPLAPHHTDPAAASQWARPPFPGSEGADSPITTPSFSIRQGDGVREEEEAEEWLVASVLLLPLETVPFLVHPPTVFEVFFYRAPTDHAPTPIAQKGRKGVLDPTMAPLDGVDGTEQQGTALVKAPLTVVVNDADLSERPLPDARRNDGSFPLEAAPSRNSSTPLPVARGNASETRFQVSRTMAPTALLQEAKADDTRARMRPPPNTPPQLFKQPMEYNSAVPFNNTPTHQEEMKLMEPDIERRSHARPTHGGACQSLEETPVADPILLQRSPPRVDAHQRIAAPPPLQREESHHVVSFGSFAYAISSNPTTSPPLPTMTPAARLSDFYYYAVFPNDRMHQEVLASGIPAPAPSILGGPNSLPSPPYVKTPTGEPQPSDALPTPLTGSSSSRRASTSFIARESGIGQGLLGGDVTLSAHLDAHSECPALS